MKPVSFAQLAAWSGGVLVHGQPERTVTRVVIDSRAILPGDLFVAIKGDRFDGHDFVEEAFRQGAIAVMTSGPVSASRAGQGHGVIRVEDTLRGLQQLAAGYRATMSARAVAVTGSNGKTSTKEFIAAVLGGAAPTAKTAGNLNNHLGVPLTLLQWDESHRWAVVEMGMNHPGEIRPLVELARPEIGVITQAGWAHIEHFSDQEAIAAEKGEVAYHLPADGLAVLQGDNPRLRALAPRISAPVAWVGRDASCTHRIGDVVLAAEESTFSVEYRGVKTSCRIPVPGLHMVENAALAVAVGLHAGLEPERIAAGLSNVVLPKGRLALKPRRKGWLLDDSYNANPDSMAAAFRTLMNLPGTGRGVALLGSMGELGSRAAELHRWVGADAASVGMGLLLALGPHAGDLVAGAREGGIEDARVCADHAELAALYRDLSRDDDRIVVKGSRSAAMEQVAGLLEN